MNRNNKFLCLSLLVVVGVHVLLIVDFGRSSNATSFSNNQGQIRIPTRINIRTQEVKVQSFVKNSKQANKHRKKINAKSENRKELSIKNENLLAGEKSAIANYISSIRDKIIALKQYPPRARRLGQEGIVEIELIINRNGQIQKSSIMKQSDYDILNQATLDLIAKVDSFDSFPSEIKKNELLVVIPVSYELVF